MDEQRETTDLPPYFWVALAGVSIVGPQLNRLLGFSWLDALINLLGVSSITFTAGFFIAILTLIGVLQWVPKSNR